MPLTEYDIAKTLAQLRGERDAAAARLLEVEPMVPIAVVRVEATDRQYQSAGLAFVKAQGPGASAASMSSAQQALTRAEHANREARVVANRLTQEREQLKFNVGYLDHRIDEMQGPLVPAGVRKV